MLPDILFLFLVACIANRQGWTEIVEWARQDHIFSWLQQFFPYNNGIPSVSTLARVISSINPDTLKDAFSKVTLAIIEIKDPTFFDNLEIDKHCAIDGKTLRRAMNSGEKSKVHIVNAFMFNINLVIGQQKVAEKSNEITAIPILLTLLNSLNLLSGLIITTDAMGCQKNIVEMIINYGANYILHIKDNQKKLFEDIKCLFNNISTFKKKDIDVKTFESKPEKDHGRITIWKITRILINDHINKWLPTSVEWNELHSVIMVTRITSSGLNYAHISEETNYYISSLNYSPQKLLGIIRNHWSVEILHYNLDWTFREDECRIRRGYGSENYSLFRKLAINFIYMIKDTLKKSMKTIVNNFCGQPRTLGPLFGFIHDDSTEQTLQQVA
jgi:predicted transposase YbfD/YdcC